MAARARDVFVIWEHVSTALTFHFEIEIATANNYLTHLIWWEDRVGTHLESCLAGFLERRSGTERNMTPAIAPGVALVPVQRIWDFTVTEIAWQLAKHPEELLLPDRGIVEATFFAMVEDVCAAALRGEQPELQEHDGEA